MMNELISESSENVGESFSPILLSLAQRMAKKIVRVFSTKVYEGMSEEDGLRILEEIFREFNCNEKWHPTKFRIGKNTTKSFRELSGPVTLAAGDLYFVDIGPIFAGHEADYGETFVFGNNHKNQEILTRGKRVFELTREKFHGGVYSGQQLYDYASMVADSFNLRLNRKMGGASNR